QAGGSTVAVFLGTGWERARESVGRYGAARAVVCSSEEFAAYQTAPQVETLAALVDERRPWGVLFASTPTGKEIAPGWGRVCASASWQTPPEWPSRTGARSSSTLRSE